MRVRVRDQHARAHARPTCACAREAVTSLNPHSCELNSSKSLIYKWTSQLSFPVSFLLQVHLRDSMRFSCLCCFVQAHFVTPSRHLEAFLGRHPLPAPTNFHRRWLRRARHGLQRPVDMSLNKGEIFRWWWSISWDLWLVFMIVKLTYKWVYYTVICYS